MKKIINFVLIVLLSLSLCACGGGNKAVYETDNLKIDGICVDDSYTDKDGTPLKMVYLFYTVTANDENMDVDSKYTEITIGENNTYKSDHFANSAAAGKYVSSYYYGSYIKEVYVGTSKKVLATFKIPEADLASGKTITLSDTQVEDMKSIRMSTDDIQHFTSPEQLAEAIDPEGYAAEMHSREDADETTASAVKQQINGYYWQFYVNNTYYELEFSSPNKFEVRTKFGKNSGTYSIKNGYIFCTYPNTQYTVEIPYEFVNGELDLDTIAGFSVYD